MNAWQSALLNQIPWLTHGTSTRVFGSQRYPNADETEDPCAENRAKFVESLGRDAGNIFLSGNEHGNVVVPVDAAALPGRVPHCDGLITSRPNIVLALKSADCLPIFFVDPIARTVAISHAGWKGVASGIAIETVRAFLARGSRPQDLLVAIGPSIGPCHYTVHDERREIMLPRTPFISTHDFVPSAEPGVWSLDLRGIVVRQLVSSGVLATNIDASAPCTACHPDRYFSYRLTHRTDQMLSVIAVRA